MKKHLIYLFLMISLFSLNISAEENNADTTAVSGVKEEEKWGIGAHPIIGYDDESSLTLGAAGVIYFEPEDKNQDLDEIELSTTYNWAKQYDLMASYSKYFKGNICSIDGLFGYQNRPDDFKGEEYEAEYFPFEIGVSFKILEKIYIGPVYKFNYSETHFDSDSADERIYGSGEIYSSGLGGQLIYNNTPKGEIYRRSGNIFKISSVHYSPLLLSSSRFTETSADYRHYFPVFNRCVFALQFAGKTSLGDMPFYSIPSLESKSLLRGGESDIGNYFLAGQTEFRFPVLWRISAAVFIGAGEVEDKIKNFGNDICVAGGGGLRIALNKKKSINLRFDIAFNNKGESGKYIKIREAF